MPTFTVRLISSGDELLWGHVADANAAWLARALFPLGGEVAGIRVVGDRLDDLVRAIREAAADARVVILTGGLGPTEDDHARDALAAAMGGVPLDECAASWRAIQDRMAAMARPCPAANRVQALVPKGAEVLPNPNGTAPGLRARIDGADVYVLPGVPSEMRAMFTERVRPALASFGGAGGLAMRRLRLHGLGESAVGEILRPWTAPESPVRVGTTVADSLVTVRLTATGADADEAAIRLAAAEAELRRLLSPHVFGQDDETLPEAVVARLAARGESVATAESCTGGWLAGAIVSAPGASKVFSEGLVAYANEAKIARLGVEPEVLAREGAVSEAVARAMAAGMRRLSGATYALGVTGIAGPDGGTPEKPVGTVWLALASPDGVAAELRRFPESRDGVRRRAVNVALDMLRRHLDDA